jgi:hypothetical protein
VVRRDASGMDRAAQWARGWLPWLARVTPNQPATYRVPSSVSLITPEA